MPSLFRYSKCNEVYKDFQCPYCNTMYSIDEWDTEYGKPLNGYDTTIKCRECDNEFLVIIELIMKVKVFAV